MSDTIRREHTSEEKAARRCKARVTVWRAVHAAHLSGEHVVVRWWNRTYDGHITEVGDDGFSVWKQDGDGAWCSWPGATAIEQPWWDTRAAVDRVYPKPCNGCIRYFAGGDEGNTP